MESKNALRVPLHFSQPALYSSKALFYRSNKDHQAHIFLVQSRSKDDIIMVNHYQVERNSFDFNSFRVPVKRPLLAHIIPDDQDQIKPQISLITTNDQFCALDLDTDKLVHNYQYQATDTALSHPPDVAHMAMLMLMCAICAYAYNGLYQIALFSVLIFGFAHHIASFARDVERDIKCTIPSLQKLHHIVSCAVYADNAIYFVGSQRSNPTQLNCFKFDTVDRRFCQLHSVDVRNISPAPTDIVEPHQMLYVEAMHSLILFTNTAHVFYLPLTDAINAKWKLFEDIVLPEIPGHRHQSMQAVVAFKGIIFLFYQREHDAMVYCWDLIFSGDLYQTDDNAFAGYDKFEDCLVVNTDTNWCHFVGKNFHCKFDLAEEIPASLSITHLQMYHSLIKQYSLECAPHAVVTMDIQMMILDYFPFFL